MLNARVGLLLIALAAIPATSSGATGVLLLAHGGSAEWNGHVTALAADVNRTAPTEVAFGMATRSTIQAGIDRLVARGVTEIVAVPLFVSSWSSIITSTEYLLGLRAEAPRALALYAKMDHSQPATPDAPSRGTPGTHEEHATSADGTRPITSPVPIRMTAALNDHAIVANILTSRARSISRTPAVEAVVIVAHGPNEDDDNRRWLADMASLADRMGVSANFASIDYLTLRDDASAPVRNEATSELRTLVARRIAEGRRVLIVPLLVSFGGIDKGLRSRLDGLSYAMPVAGLVPDDHLVTWVLTMAGVRPASHP